MSAETQAPAVPPPTKAKRTKATDLPDLLTLARVEFDRERSNREADYYLAQSDSRPAERHTVVYHKDSDTWTCSGTYCGKAKQCRHRTRAKVLAAARWWERELATASVAELRRLAVGKAAQVRTDCDALDAAACLITIEALLLGADAAGEGEAAA